MPAEKPSTSENDNSDFNILDQIADEEFSTTTPSDSSDSEERIVKKTITDGQAFEEASGDSDSNNSHDEAVKINPKVKKTTSSKLAHLIVKAGESIFPKANASDDFLGRVLNKKYGIKSILRKDDFVITYSGRSLTDRKKVVVKTPYFTNEIVVSAFKDFANANLKLKHPNIINYIDYFENSRGRPFLVSEYNIGITIDELLDDVQSVKSAQEYHDLIKQVLEALEYAHSEDIIHGGIKSSNILLVEEDEQIVLKLSDFNIAELKRSVLKYAERDWEFEDFSDLSPELINNDDLVKASDVYNIGLLSYQMITGQEAYVHHSREDYIKAHSEEKIKPKPIAELRPDFHNVEDLSRIISEALDTDPDWRYQSIEELKEELGNWVTSEAKSIEIEEEEIVEDPKTKELKPRSMSNTMHNLVALKKHQVEQEETTIVKLVDVAKKSGPRESPKKTLARLIITYVGGAGLLLLVGIYSILYWDNIKEFYFIQEKKLGAMLWKKKEVIQEDSELPPMEGGELPTIANNKKSKTKASRGKNSNKKAKKAKKDRRKRFKYEESPSYRPFLPKERNKTKEELIDPDDKSRFINLKDHM